MKTKKNNKLKKVSIVFSVLLVAGLSFAFFQQTYTPPGPLWSGMPSTYTYHNPYPGQYALWSPWIIKGVGGPYSDAYYHERYYDWMLEPADAGTITRYHTFSETNSTYLPGGGYEFLRQDQSYTWGMSGCIPVETWKAPPEGTPNRVPLWHYANGSSGYSFTGAVRMGWDPFGLGSPIPVSDNYGGGSEPLSNPDVNIYNSKWQFTGIGGYICTKPTTHNGVSYNIPMYRKKKTVTQSTLVPNNTPDVITFYLYTTDINEGNSCGWVSDTRLGYVGSSIYKCPPFLLSEYDPLLAYYSSHFTFYQHTCN